MNLGHKHRSLDTLRWLAAFSVGMGHAAACFPIVNGFNERIHFSLTTVFNGAYAVDLFFVLSGFVLINAASSPSVPNYLGFVSRRALRIYPAAWLSLALALSVVLLLRLTPNYGSPWTSAWAESLLRLPDMTVAAMLNILSLNQANLNPILWTIKVELVVSAVYPFIAVFVWKRAYVALSILALVGIFASFLYPLHAPVSLPIRYLYMFVVGAALNLLPQKKGAGGWLLLVGAITLMVLSRFFGQNHGFIEDVISSISALIVVYAIAYRCPKSLDTFLRQKSMNMLGASSYSYYLLNPPILFVLANLYPAFGISPPSAKYDYLTYSIILGLAAAFITIPIAILSSRTVEKASIVLGRRLESYIQSKAFQLRQDAKRSMAKPD